jgi:hypothetical protein
MDDSMRHILMDTPMNPQLPQTNKYPLPQFYVRECYDQYYNQAFQLLQTYEQISVTGTKGIGKSMFYLYTFNRLRKEHPDWTVFAASFRKKTQKFESGSVIFPDGKSDELDTFEDLRKTQRKVLLEQKPVIALYDGAPEVKPKCRMICFTSYDASWFLAAKDMVHTHKTLFMSTWSFEELLEARDALKFTISDKQLEENFAEFGGVARVCFLDPNSAKEKDVYKAHKWSLDQGIQEIQNFDHFVRMLKNEVDPEQIPHRLFKFVPDLDMNNFMAYLEPISAKVESAISKHLMARNHAERISMLLKLEGVAKASSFYGFLFEPHVHEVLIRKRNFEIRSLEDVSFRTLEITAECQIEFMEKKSYAEYAAKFLQIPLASNYRSCDSWFVDKQKRLVVFFQVTSSYHHPVCYEGIENVLVKLSQSNQDIVNYDKILLFVVPDTLNEIMSIRFTEQQIERYPESILPYSKKNVSVDASNMKQYVLGISVRN